MESEGIELQCSELIPSDPYSLKLIEKHEMEKQRIGQNDLKDLGNKQFNRIDGKVLRFYAILGDQDQQCKTSRKFIIYVIHQFHRDYAEK